MEENMDVGCVPITLSAIEKMLAEEGLFRGTTAFVDEFDRRYRPSDRADGTYVEREDWDGMKIAHLTSGQTDGHHLNVI